MRETGTGGGVEVRRSRAWVSWAVTGAAAVTLQVAGALRTNVALLEPDGTTTKVNEPGPTLTAQDVDRLRFSTGLRGYRMDEVDRVLDRVAVELRARQAEVDELREQLGGQPDVGEEPAPVEVLPPLPRADVPPGHVWPIPRGREILRGLVDQPLDRLPAPPRPAHDPPLLLAVGGWRLCTRPSQRFAAVDVAHAALVERVRQTRPCAGVLASEIVLVVQPEPDGGGRLWHVAPRLDGIREHLALRPPQARPRVLAALAATIVAVLRLWLRHQVALELNLSAFAVEAGRVVHLGDPLTSKQTQLGAALLGFCERLSGDAAALAAFTAALEQELAGREPLGGMEADVDLRAVEARVIDLFGRHDLELVIGAIDRLLFRAPPAELRCMTEAAALHVVVSDFDDQFGTKRLP